MTAPETEDRVSDEQDVLTTESDERAGDEPVEATSETDGRRSMLLLVALLAASVLIMVSGLIAWAQASGDPDVDRAETRDAVLIAARQHIETIQSLDYRKVEQGLKAWKAATTGTLNDSIKGIDAEDQKLLVDQKKQSSGKVVDAAVIDLDKNTATVIAAIEVTVIDGADPDAEPTIKRNRYSADMVLVRGSWKLEDIGQVPVDAS